MVNKAKLIEKIAESSIKKSVLTASQICEMNPTVRARRVVIELRRDANANVILNQLYKHTQMQDTFGVIMLALVDGQPKVLSLLDMLKCYIGPSGRCRYQKNQNMTLNKAEERDHILQGLLIALRINIDEVIQYHPQQPDPSDLQGIV